MEAIKALFVCAIVMQVQTNPVPVTQDKSSRNILELMSKDPKVCKFPPRDMFSQPPRFIAPCDKEIPSVETSDGGLRQYADEDDAYAFLCMGFYDLSLRICDSQLNSTPPLFNDVNQFQNMFNDATKDATFCKDLQPYVVSDSGVQPGLTQGWVQVLNANLADQETCSSWCTHRKKGTVFTICKILLWGRKLLHDTNRGPLTNAQPAVALAAQVHPVDTQTSIGAQDQSTFAGYTDLEAKDTVSNNSSSGTTYTQETISSDPVSRPQGVESSEIHSAELTKPQSNSPNVVSNHSEGTEKIISIPAVEHKVDNSSNAMAPPKGFDIKPKEPSQQEPQPELHPGDKLSSVQQQPGEQAKKSSTSPSSSVPTSSLTSLLSTEFQQQGLEEPQEEVHGGLADSNELQYQDAGNNRQEEDDDEMTFSQDKESTSRTGPVIPPGRDDSAFFAHHPFTDSEDSHFFAYFLTLVVICMVAYVVFHNKQKILALALEGRKGGRSSRRRPSTSSYRKLDSNLEEAISSAAPRTNPHVIY